ncbi:MFS general substrate transporter [Lophiostoma macrostomum CBS 122681]|uniref:MFS general substrate transporter n=1 Tax=Lophiostoma macrostomum CBS 122681 TaxID=1314788 RepID=A0A6A6TGK2_9PLEO|nr:MFS general substrate transporter [Lophiostoma macrostomum CBS 122681]
MEKKGDGVEIGSGEHANRSLVENFPGGSSKQDTRLSAEVQAPSSETNRRMHPIDWPRRKKWAATVILSGFAFLQPLSETMLSTVENQVTRAINIQRPYDWILVNSLILIGVGLSPLLLAPLSEVYGRKPILLCGTSFFVVWNTACGAAKNLEQMLAFRLLSGFGASCADAIAGGLMSDLWRPEERGKAFAVFMVAPLLGPALGPICGAFISEGTSWTWVFWVTSIASAVVVVIAFFFLHETFVPRLEQRWYDEDVKKGRIQGPPRETAPFLDLMRTDLQRPFRLLGTQPIVQLLATYMALLYGTMFLFLFMYPKMWNQQYHQSVRIGSLNYVSVAIGLICGVNIAGHLNDRVYVWLKARNNNIGRPEYRIPAMVIGTALVPLGIICWGWTGQRKVHWIVPNLGSLVFAMGVYICSGCVSVYTIDAYAQYAASAISTNLVLRSLTAAFFPLFAPYMFESLGFGWGATVLGGAFAAFGIGVVYILWFHGASIRARSTYCATKDEVEETSLHPA